MDILTPMQHPFMTRSQQHLLVESKTKTNTPEKRDRCELTVDLFVNFFQSSWEILSSNKMKRKLLQIPYI
ncbi:unnamed protein product [Rhizophagus irregularis]|nr:unnamed protein product [Rhizophagus irregularis]